jgi:hypothetical protein
MVRARETSGPKSKTPTPAIRKASQKQNMLLQPTEILSPIHPRRVPSNSFSPWWSWWWFHRLKQSRSGESQRNKWVHTKIKTTTAQETRAANQNMMLQLMEGPL